MKKFHFLSIFLLSLLSLPAFSKTLSPEEALQRVSASMTRSETQEKYVHKFTMNTFKNEPSVYIFKKNNSKGFLVLSADDCAPAILGYSDHETFDPSNIPPELKYWLNEYSNQIEFLRESGSSNEGTRSDDDFAGMKAIAPLLKSKWNQGTPYNEYCFTISSNGQETKSVTGCVATSMAQVMYYFQYPTIGHGEISYKHENSGTYSMNFGQQPFDWKEMLPEYYPDSYNTQQGEAVAYLMKACGYSVKMDYSKGESGANGTAIAGALIDYFGYNQGINVQTRKFHTYKEWAQLIYTNLNEIGPVVYNGSALDGGHSFVCDGYDGKGYFHFNWGWGGMSDGYYLLDALNPDEYGIGGAAGGYNLGQQIILGITPKQMGISNRQVMQFGSVTGKITNDVLSIELTHGDDDGFQYINPEPVTISFGIMVKNITNPSNKIQYFESDKKDLECKQGSFYKWDEIGISLDLKKVSMTENEEYNFIISTNITADSISQWKETVVMPGKYNFVTITKTKNGYNLTNHAINNLSVTDFEVISSPIYYDNPIEFSAKFNNNSKESLTRNYSAVFFDENGRECFKMENYSVNVDANSSETQEWTSVQWYKEKDSLEITEPTDYILRLYDNWEGTYVDGIETSVTVLPQKKSETKIESQLTIVDAQKDGDIYIISGNQFEASLYIKVLEGYLNQSIMLAIQMPLTNGEYYTIMHKHFNTIPDLSAGEEQTLNIDVLFEDAKPDTIYRLEVWGPDGGFDEKMSVKFNVSNSGISSIIPDSSGQYKVYSINGTQITVCNDRSELDSLPRGIYIVNGKKISIVN